MSEAVSRSNGPLFQSAVNLACVLVALGALATAVWVVASGQIEAQGLDAVFLIIVCLAIAATFGMIPAMAIRQGTWKVLPSRRGSSHEQRSGS